MDEKRIRLSICACRVREIEGFVMKDEPLDEEERMVRGIGRDKADIVELKWKI